MSSIVSYAKGLIDLGFSLRAKYVDSDDTKFFRDGFGDLDQMYAFDKKLMEEGDDGFDDIEIEKVEAEKHSTDAYKVYRGSFVSPAKDFIEDPIASIGQVEIVEPVTEMIKGAVVLVPMTGDEGFGYRRSHIAIPLANAGFVTISLIPAFYGKRRPAKAKTCNSSTFSEFTFVYWSAFLEAGKLVKWMKETYPGVTPGINGLSQGGIMTVNGSTYTKSDVVLIPVVAGLRMYEGFRQGVMNSAISKRTIRSKEDIKKLDDLMKWVSCAHSIQGFLDRGAPKGRKVTIRLITAKNDRFIPSASSKDLAAALQEYGTKFTQVKVSGGHATTIKDSRSIVVPQIIRAFEEHANYEV